MLVRRFGALPEWVDARLNQAEPRELEYTDDRTETWVLVHVKVQGEPERGFEERMYVYLDTVWGRIWVS